MSAVLHPHMYSIGTQLKVNNLVCCESVSVLWECEWCEGGVCVASVDGVVLWYVVC